MSDNEKLCGIYEMKKGVPTKLRIKNLVFALNPGFTVLEIIDKTLDFTDLLDFTQPVTLAQEETVQTEPLQSNTNAICTPNEIKERPKEEESKNDMLDLIHNTTIHQSTITVLYNSYADVSFTGLELEEALKTVYPHLSATTLRSRRSAYTSYLLKNNFVKVISKTKYKSIFEFIKTPEWISDQRQDSTEEFSQKEENFIEV